MPKKSHTISGNKRFMTKRAIPILKKYGIKNVKAAERGGFFLELTFDIDDAKLQKLDKELKKANKSAYGGVLEQIRKIIREEIQKLNEENESLWTWVYKGFLDGFRKAEKKGKKDGIALSLDEVAHAAAFLVKTEFGSGAKSDFIKTFKRWL
jgi:hypothetical protein